MRRSRMAFWACVGAVVVVGCDGTSTLTDVLPARDPLVRQLVAAGFRRDMIEDRGAYFLVEQDIRISKAALQAQQPGTPLGRPEFQWRTDSMVGQTQVQNIVIDLSGLSDVSAWQNSARQALVEWNNVNCGAVHLSEGSPGDITVSTIFDSDHPGTAATATFPLDAEPGSGKPGPTIDVNTAYTGTPNDSLTKLRTMVHEIGHTIAFRHTNWQARNEGVTEYGAVQLPNTPATDAASVMNGGTATEGWSSFSYYDRVATRTMYFNESNCEPLLAPSLSFRRCTGFAGFAEIAATTNSEFTTLTVQRSPHGQNAWVAIGSFPLDQAGVQHVIAFPTSGAQDVRAWSTDPQRSSPDSPIRVIGPIDC